MRKYGQWIDPIKDPEKYGPESTQPPNPHVWSALLH